MGKGIKTGGSAENLKEELATQDTLIANLVETIVGKSNGATATENTILEGYSAYVGQELKTGTYLPHGDYAWKQLTSENGTFIKYVASDDSTKYPDGGTQNGFWYELVKDVPDVLTPSLYTRVAVDKITYQSDTELSDITLNHSLGTYPLIAILMGKPAPKSNQNTVITAVALFSKDYKYPNTTYQYYGTSGEISSSCQFSSIAATTATLRMDGVALQANVEYTLITMA